MERATEILFREIRFVEENTSLVDFLSFAIIIKADFRDGELSTLVCYGVVLPHFGGKFLGGGGDASFIFFAEVISAIAAATVVGEFFIDAFAAINSCMRGGAFNPPTA